jgi:hypothetical protein
VTRFTIQQRRQLRSSIRASHGGLVYVEFKTGKYTKIPKFSFEWYASVGRTRDLGPSEAEDKPAEAARALSGSGEGRHRSGLVVHHNLAVLGNDLRGSI